MPTHPLIPAPDCSYLKHYHIMPGPAVAAPNPRTLRSSIARHPHQLQHDHPARTASWNLRRFPNAASKAWNVLPPSLLQHRPELKRMQALKTKSTATSSTPIGWQPRTVCDCSHAATCSRHYYILLYIFHTLIV